VQCWSDSGDLIWSKRWGYSDNDSASDLVLAGDYIYVCGRSYINAVVQAEYVLLKLSTTGDVLDARRYGDDQSNMLYCIAATEIGPGEHKFYAAGRTFISQTESDPTVIRLDGNLVLEAAHEWQGSGFGLEPTSIALSGQAQQQIVMTLTATNDGSTFQGAFLEFNTSETPITRMWDAEPGFRTLFCDLCTSPEGDYICCGRANPVGGGLDTALLMHIAGSGALLEQLQYSAEESSQRFYSLAYLPDDRVATAGWIFPNGANGGWGSITLNSSTVNGSWVEIALNTGLLSVSSFSEPGITKEINTGVLDTGAGMEDALIVVSPAP